MCPTFCSPRAQRVQVRAPVSIASIAARIALALFLASGFARAGSIDVRCAVPPPVRAELEARVTVLFSNAGMGASTIGLECDELGAWIVWVDGSRARIDPSPGFVQGAIYLIESRLAYDRNYAAESTPPVDNETPPTEDTAPVPAKKRHLAEAEGGVGFAMMTEFWSGASDLGIGPRLEVSVGPPGPFSLVIGEGLLLGVGSASSSQVVMFDLQAGIAYGAPSKKRTGFGAVLLLGAERIAAANAASDVNGLWLWTATADLGARGSLKLSSANVWLGADLLLRTSEFETGRPAPIRIPTTSFLMSMGCFFPAFAAGAP